MRVADFNRQLRPSLDYVECQDYIITIMKLCWSEDSSIRPNIRPVRRALKPIIDEIVGMSLMEHMMNKMETYQNQLEDLVDERTAQLQDEKKRTENLLQRMLPM